MYLDSLALSSGPDSDRISTIFLGLALPATMVTEEVGTPSVSASNARTAALALPLSAGDVTRTFNRSPSQPAISPLEAPGTTFSKSRAVPSVTVCLPG